MIGSRVTSTDSPACPLFLCRYWLASLLWAGLVLATLPKETLGDTPPNVVLILADDVGIEPLGCYGGTSFSTPQIDRLATSGLRFQHCYSMPVCHPTRICLLTGRYPRHVQNPRWGSFPPHLEMKTLAHAMKQRGYATAVAGKWQLTLLGQDPNHPHRLGFDEYSLFGWHEGPRYHDPWIWKNGNRVSDTEGKFGPDLYVDFLIDFMSRHRKTPFFVFYSMGLCHDVTDDLEEPVPYVPGKDRYLNYGEMVAAMDHCVGRIVSALQELQLRENTVIIFTGDNGTASRSIIRAEPVPGGGKKWKYIREEVVCEIDGRQVRGGKGSLKDGGTHVPLLVSWPGTVAAGQTVDDLVDFSDFLPTLAELGGRAVDAGYSADGHNFAKLIRGTGPGTRSWAYAESKGRYWVRTQRWKLYSSGEFFDLQQDPGEMQPLSDAETGEAAAVAKSSLRDALDKL